MLIRDFNEACWQPEHLSRARCSKRLMMDFREVLSHYDVYDLDLIGVPWNYKQACDRNVRVQLDWAVVSLAWSARFSKVRVKHIMSSQSDHCPLLLTIEQVTNQRSSNTIRQYEIMWEHEPSLASAVEDTWSRRVGALNLGVVNASFHMVMLALYDWKKKYFGSVPRRLEKKRKELNLLVLKTDDQSIADWKHILSEVLVLKDGDQNT